MMVFVAQLMIDHDQPLGVMRERQLPRHADAAMELDGFAREARADLPDRMFGRR